jgi:hypothetical protein
MQLTMQNAEHLNQEQIQEFLESSAEIEFAGRGRAEIYASTERVVVAQEFAGRGALEHPLPGDVDWTAPRELPLSL